MTVTTLSPACLHSSSTALLQESEALHLLSQPEFAAQWDLLADCCPWSTVYQRKEFVMTWYEIYQASYSPVMLYAIADKKLTGLLTLAIDKKGNVTGAGANQAEYQVWLSDSAAGYTFIKAALEKIRETFPAKELQLKYLPAGTPIEGIRQDAGLQPYCLFQAYAQPLMQVDDTLLDTELRKKNKREKLNRLRRQGELHFEKITGYSDFAALLTELAPQYDFRKGATVNITPFRDDKLKQEFLLRLFELNQLHVSVLKLNDTIIASNVGTLSPDCLHLQGINTHSPFYARYSPGILHFLLLGKQLCSENISHFDLTPGGDSYKEQLATHYATVHTLTFAKPSRLFRKAQKLKWTNALKAAVNRYSGNAGSWKQLKKHVRNSTAKVKTAFYSGLRSMLSAKLLASNAYRRSIVPQQIRPQSLKTTNIQLKKNNVSNLLAYKARGWQPTRWQFLETAMKKFDAGEHCYTWMLPDGLQACIWLKITCTPDQEKVYLSDLYIKEGLPGDFIASALVMAREEFPHAIIITEVPA